MTLIYKKDIAYHGRELIALNYGSNKKDIACFLMSEWKCIIVHFHGFSLFLYLPPCMMLTLAVSRPAPQRYELSLELERSWGIGSKYNFNLSFWCLLNMNCALDRGSTSPFIDPSNNFV